MIPVIFNCCCPSAITTILCYFQSIFMLLVVFLFCFTAVATAASVCFLVYYFLNALYIIIQNTFITFWSKQRNRKKIKTIYI